ncbi:MAG: hypothetical protein OEY19_09935 [Gammaproteobacteria bacterium]|nr:hypothetical protein [Gammaproteobacteria bacterium]
MRWIITGLFFLSNTIMANGWMLESPYLKSGEIQIDNSLQLESEDVLFELYEDEFKTTVIYRVKSEAPDYKGHLSFPVLCKNGEYETDKIDCIKNFNVYVNEQKTKSNEGSLDELNQFNQQFKTNVYDKKTIAQHFVKESQYSPPESNDAYIKMFNALVQSSKKDFSIKIEYTTPYYYNWSGFSKSSFYYYSNDLIYYDFTPAASWVKEPAKFLNVTVRNLSTRGSILFPEGWKFEKNGNNWQSKVTPFSPSKTQRLIVGVDQSGYKQYTSHQRLTKDIPYTVSSDDTLEHKANRYSASNTFDGKPETAWCTSQSRSTINLTITPKDKQSYGCSFEGIALFNGYTQSEEIWKSNRRVKHGIITILGEFDVYFAAYFDLPPITNNLRFNPYNYIQYISERTDTINEKLKGSKPYLSFTSQDKLKIEIKILETYESDKDKDTCISEIYPIYNCG